MITLGTLKNTTRYRKKCKRVGRGPGSGLGKTCGRGEKGAGARSGYKRRFGYEGGQFRNFMKIPIRGFNNANFRTEYDVVNLAQISSLYEDGEVVNIKTMKERGFFNGTKKGLKVLGNGEISKKVTIEADAYSKTALDKLQKAKISFTTNQ